MPVAALAREGEPGPLPRVRPRLVEHHQRVALGDGREVAVDHGGRRQHALGGQPVEPVPQPRPALGLDQLLVRRPLPGARPAQAPLAEEQGALVDQPGVLGHGEALDHAGAPERRGRDRVVQRDVRAVRDGPGRLGLGGLAPLRRDPLRALVPRLALGPLRLLRRVDRRRGRRARGPSWRPSAAGPRRRRGRSRRGPRRRPTGRSRRRSGSAPRRRGAPGASRRSRGSSSPAGSPSSPPSTSPAGRTCRRRRRGAPRRR